ncbi:unnamed protein product [Prorocentrum cordatum]|uniref:EF-hand domain-containing protein n=1 Tax=Prorocentrum cordatum TaxID=2364126 RepID=A0ABN9Y856_9DINO|nr:unnamed protein product [Polarella glacialis]
MYEEADTNSDGYLDAEEVKRFFARRAKAAGQGELPPSDELIEDCISMVDRDGDGRIDLHEFTRLLGECLPNARVARDREFRTDVSACKMQWDYERASRIFSNVMAAAWHRSALRWLSAAAAITLGAAGMEAALLVNPAHPGAAEFVAVYALEQLFPSLVWMTSDARLVAGSLGHCASELLLSHDPASETGAAALLAAGHCQVVRCMSVGFCMFGQLLRIGGERLRAQRVRAARPPRRGGAPVPRRARACRAVVREVVGHLGGEPRWYHILPVMNPESMRGVARRISHEFRYPLFLNVPVAKWGQTRFWEPLLKGHVTPSWLLQGHNGERVLCIEVDGTDKEEGLVFGRRSHQVGINEAGMAFRAIASVALDSLAQSGLDRGSPHL